MVAAVKIKNCEKTDIKWELRLGLWTSSEVEEAVQCPTRTHNPLMKYGGYFRRK
jgi:hypothetical protein